MTIHGLFFRLLGWAPALGLIFGELTFNEDGTSDGLNQGAGALILVFWAWTIYGAVSRLAGDEQDRRQFDAPPASSLRREASSSPDRVKVPLVLPAAQGAERRPPAKAASDPSGSA